MNHHPETGSIFLQSPSPVTAYFEESTSSTGLPFHFHHEHELIFVTEGVAEFTIENSEYRLRPGSLLVIGSLERHERSISGFPYRRYILSVSDEFLLQSVPAPELSSLFLYRPEGFRHHISLDDMTAMTMAGVFQTLIRESGQRNPFWDIRCSNLLNELLITLYRRHPEQFPAGASPAHMELLLSVQKYMNEHFREPISLQDAADAHFISRFHLSRIFRETTGYHFKEYLTLLRMNEARRLLAATSLPVAAVGEECGYPDVNHFIRTFREHEGISPLKYRKKLNDM